MKRWQIVISFLVIIVVVLSTVSFIQFIGPGFLPRYCHEEDILAISIIGSGNVVSTIKVPTPMKDNTPNRHILDKFVSKHPGSSYTNTTLIINSKVNGSVSIERDILVSNAKNSFCDISLNDIDFSKTTSLNGSKYIEILVLGSSNDSLNLTLIYTHLYGPGKGFTRPAKSGGVESLAVQGDLTINGTTLLKIQHHFIIA